MSDNAQSRAFYDAVATDYDEIVGFSSYVGELEPFLRQPATKISRVLDVGAGTGHSIEGILVWTRPVSVVAVDVSAPMLAQLQTKFPQVETVHGDILDYLATAPEPFDLITAFSVFELLSDFNDVIAAVARALTPGGILAFTYEPLRKKHAAQNAAESRYSDEDVGVDYTIYRRRPKDVRAMLERCGLTIVAEYKLPDAYDRYGTSVDLRFVAARR